MDKKIQLPLRMRNFILKNPSKLLDDTDFMTELFQVNSSDEERNVVDLRGVLMKRLEGRLSKLEDTYHHVISNAYDNVAGTQQIHRTVIKLLDQQSFEDFIEIVSTDLKDILQIQSVKIFIETAAAEPGKSVGPDRHEDVIKTMPLGGLTAYLKPVKADNINKIILRTSVDNSNELHEDSKSDIKSEALIQLNLGADNSPALLVMGSEDVNRFNANQGTDLLLFFAQTFERIMQRWVK